MRRWTIADGTPIVAAPGRPAPRRVARKPGRARGWRSALALTAALARRARRSRARRRRLRQIHRRSVAGGPGRRGEPQDLRRRHQGPALRPEDRRPHRAPGGIPRFRSGPISPGRCFRRASSPDASNMRRCTACWPTPSTSTASTRARSWACGASRPNSAPSSAARTCSTRSPRSASCIIRAISGATNFSRRCA